MFMFTFFQLTATRFAQIDTHCENTKRAKIEYARISYAMLILRIFINFKFKPIFKQRVNLLI